MKKHVTQAICVIPFASMETGLFDVVIIFIEEKMRETRVFSYCCHGIIRMKDSRKEEKMAFCQQVKIF